MFHVAQLLRMDGRRAAGWFMTVPRALAPQMLQTQMEIREAVPHVGPCGWILDLGSLGSSACAHTHATGHTLFHDTQVGVLAVMLICFISPRYIYGTTIYPTSCISYKHPSLITEPAEFYSYPWMEISAT